MLQGPRAGRPRRAIPWLGLAAVIAGLALIRLYFDHPRLETNPNPIIAVVYLGTGCVLVVWGARALITELAAIALRGRDRPQQRRTRMPPEAVVYGLILLVLCAGALLGHSNMLMLVFGLTAGPFVLNGQMNVGILNGLRVARRLPPRATVGENFAVTLCLANRKRLWSSWMVVAEDMVHVAGEQMQPAVLFTCVPARSQREAAYEIRPGRRGMYEFGPVRVLSRFPLGLMERSFEVGNIEQLVVTPRIGRLKPRWRQAAERGQAVTDLARTRAGAGDDEFHRLREYRGGDNPRAIHWRTTARRNELMVREYQQYPRRDVLLVVDLWLPARAKAEELERAELAVSFAASICVEQMQFADSAVDLLLCGTGTSRVVGPAGARSIDGLLEELAVVQGGPAERLAAALREAAADSMPQVRKVLITTRSRDTLHEALRGNGEGEGGGSVADFEVIEADAKTLMEYLEFDDWAAGRGRA
ncbi:MAG: DUF58 domain-containing protein [Deltaproteobacteria bacterium]